MKHEEERFVDKTQWGRGPWDNEPDRLAWEDEETKLPCLMVRNTRSGHWCGYVGVSSDHPYFEKGQGELKWLKGFDNMISTGRQGLFRYGNMDHSIAMGHAIARRTIDARGIDHSEVAASQEYFG